MVGGKRSENNWVQRKQHEEGKFTTVDGDIKYGVWSKEKRTRWKLV